MLNYAPASHAALEPRRSASLLRSAGDARDRDAVQELLDRAGIVLDGARPFDIRVNDARAYRAMLSGSLGFGEAYMDGWWDCAALDQAMARIFRADLASERPSLRALARIALAAVTNRQGRSRAFDVAHAHYDVGNDIFDAMLDAGPRLTPCGYWEGRLGSRERPAREARSRLPEARARPRHARPRHRLRLRRVHEACDAALRRRVHRLFGLRGADEDREASLPRPLPVQIILDDYRAIQGTYDRVVSIGMLEAVGYRNYRTFMQVVHDRMTDEGLALIHTNRKQPVDAARRSVERRVHLPERMLPSIAQLGQAMEGLFVMEDWHNFGPDYDRTLMAWHERFQAAWPRLSASHPERFKRMWELYLLGFAGGFRVRSWQLWQIVLSKPGRAQPDCRL